MTTLLPEPRLPLEDSIVLTACGLNFVAIDVETANSRRGSICAIGAAVVRGGVVVSTHSWLTRPPAGMDRFDGINVSLHGITPEMVADQPAFAERLDQLLELADGLPLVAHNATFDIGALREACVAVDRDWPATDYACSLIIARRALDLISYRLPMVAIECGVDLVRAPRSRFGCAGLRPRRSGARSPPGCRKPQRPARGRTGTHRAAGDRRLAWLPRHPDLGAPTASRTPPPTPTPSTCCSAQIVVFTGALSIRRQEAWDAVASCGAVVETGVNKRTTMLVVGDGFTGHDPAEFWTGKAAKATKWRAKGHQIEVLTEADLVDLLTETRTSGVRESVPA